MTTQQTNTSRLTALIDGFDSKHILCVGDVMLDRYVYGSVNRISPEAPIPVLAIDSERAMLGAAGNVVRNIISLGGTASLIGVIGDDEDGLEILRLIQNEERLESNLITIPGRQTTVKTRHVAGAQQLLRSDKEDTTPLTGPYEDQLLRSFDAQLEDAAAIVLSDYAKGVLTRRVLSALIEKAQRAGKPIIADPKNDDFSVYRGVTVLKPNAIETQRATGIACSTDEGIQAAAQNAMDATDAKALVITRSEKGMSVFTSEKTEGWHFRPQVAEVFDVSGAGDTSLAALGLAIAANASFSEAAELANFAGSLAVAKMGTAVVDHDEMANALQSRALESAEAKIKSLPHSLEWVDQWRKNGQTIGFTNGCFDLLHPGHVSLLSQAKGQCDLLIVGLNTDASIKRLKGETRPINPEMARAIVLASLETVDLVIQFADDTPEKLIEAIRPDVLVKGADYTIETVVGSDFVQSYGGKVYLAKLKPGHSTTDTISKLSQKKAVS